VFRYKGRRDPSVILGSSIGEDAALISFGKQILVLTTDPVTGTLSEIGSLAVDLNANDIACRGATPKWFLCTLLLPEGSNTAVLDKIMRQVDSAAKQIGVAVVGGHTEVTPGLNRPIVIGYMMGVAAKGKFVTSSGGKAGDHIILTRSAGIEGTSILAADFPGKLRGKVSSELLRNAKKLRRLTSVVDDALTAVRVGGVHAMHDPTEGGLLQGVWEVAEASRVGFVIHESRIHMLPETKRICSALKVDPLKLLSSGCLLIIADQRKSAIILSRLSMRGIPASIIGTITHSKTRKLIKTNGSTKTVGPSERDEIYRIIEKYPIRRRASQ
jgi:hydrogenase expression/formation protein HypE